MSSSICSAALLRCVYGLVSLVGSAPNSHARHAQDLMTCYTRAIYSPEAVSRSLRPFCAAPRGR